MESADTGIVSTVVGALMPIFSQISPSLYLIFCLVIFIVITQVAHNVILAIVFTPVLAAIGIDMGIDPFMFQILFAYGLQLAFYDAGSVCQCGYDIWQYRMVDDEGCVQIHHPECDRGHAFAFGIGIPAGFLIILKMGHQNEASRDIAARLLHFCDEDEFDNHQMCLKVSRKRSIMT